MEPPQQLSFKNNSEEIPKREISELSDAKPHHLVNYDDFNFEEFQFKSKKKTQPRVTRDPLELPISILECPLCGCKSKTDLAKARHLKGCAKKRAISFSKVKEATELQKRQAEERRLIGLPSVPPKAPRGTKRNAALNRQLEPQTELQADLQMALAMSLSLQQKEKKAEDQERFYLEALTGESEKKDNLNFALKSGSTCDEKLPALPGRKTRKKQQCLTPFWMIRPKEQTNIIRAERIVKILSEQSIDSDEENCPFILNWKKIRPQCTIPWPSAGHCRLWEASTLPEAIRSDPNSFFVKTLEHWFPPHDAFASKVGQKQHSINVEKRRKSEEVQCFPSTLAALNALDANISLTQKDLTMETNLDGFLLDNTYGDGFLTQAEQNVRMDFDISSQIVQRLLFMVNNKALSDVDIIIKKDEVIPCHKFVLYTNCPEAYQELIQSPDVTKLWWLDISREGAISFLQFVYGGVFTASKKKEMKRLAMRYNMQELLKVLSCYNFPDNDERCDEQEPLKLKNTSRSSSPSVRRSPSPILTSSSHVLCSSSPVLTSESDNGKSATHESAKNDDPKISNESLHREDLIDTETIIPRIPRRPSACFNPSSKNPIKAYAKLSHTGSSIMSPELFSMDQDSNEKRTPEDFKCSELVKIPSKRRKNNMPIATLFSTFGSAVQNYTPETATSTPIKNKLSLHKKQANTFSISPLLAERSACLQASQDLKPKHLLGVFNSAESSSSRYNEVKVVLETPEMNSKDVGSSNQIRSSHNIYDEDSWEKFKYGSESESVANDSQVDGESHSSLDSLVLKRKLASVNLESTSLSMEMKPKGRKKTESKQREDVQKLLLPDDSLSYPDEHVSDEDILATNSKPELELSVGAAIRNSSPDKCCLKLSSVSTSNESYSGQNNTWDDFPEGYYSVENLQLADGSLVDHAVHRDSGCDNLSLTPSKRFHSPTSPKRSAQLSTSFNLGIRKTHSVKLKKSLDVYVPDHQDLLETLPRFGSPKNTWNGCMDDQYGKAQCTQSEDDLPDIDYCPLTLENMRFEDCAANCAPVSEPNVSSTPKQTHAVKKRKLDKKVTKKACVTPMPHYSIMETPVIKKELKKIGVRALPKKKGVTVLKHIYMETHKASITKSPWRINEENGDTTKSPIPTFKEDLGNSRSDSDNGVSKEQVVTMKSKRLTKTKKNVGTSKDTMGTQQCRSQSKENNDSPAKKSPVKGGNKGLLEFGKEDLKAFIFVNAELRTRIVNYQPIDFKRLHSDMKASGLKPTVQELQDFLDDQCITYTSLEESSPRKSKSQTCRRGKSKH